MPMWTAALVATGLVTILAGLYLSILASEHFEWGVWTRNKVIAHTSALVVVFAGAYVIHTVAPTWL